MAKVCRTVLVEPPMAMSSVMAFSNALRVRIVLGRKSRWSMSITTRPTRAPTSSLRGSVAGTLAAVLIAVRVVEAVRSAGLQARTARSLCSGETRA